MKWLNPKASQGDLQAAFNSLSYLETRCNFGRIPPMSSDSAPPVILDQALIKEHRWKEQAGSYERLAQLAAHSDTQSAHIAAQLLLGLNDGSEYPFDLTKLSRVDFETLKDVFYAIEFRVREQIEPHELFIDGDRLFEYLANSWEIQPKSFS